MDHPRQSVETDMELEGKSNSVPACFFLADAVDRKVTGLQVCRACEATAGGGSIVGAQRLYALWRIYPAIQEARNQLLILGICVNKMFISAVGVSPMISQRQTELTCD